MDMLYQTTKDHESLRQAIREFAENEIKPIAFALDQNNEFPDEIVKKIGENNWMGLPYSKKDGGAGLDVISYAIAVEELSRGRWRGRSYFICTYLAWSISGRSIWNKRAKRKVFSAHGKR